MIKTIFSVNFASMVIKSAIREPSPLDINMSQEGVGRRITDYSSSSPFVFTNNINGTLE